MLTKQDVHDKIRSAFGDKISDRAIAIIYEEAVKAEEANLKDLDAFVDGTARRLVEENVVPMPSGERALGSAIVAGAYIGGAIVLIGMVISSAM